MEWGGRGVCLGGSGPYPALPHPATPSGAWRTVATVCAVVPPTSPVCVTWAGRPTCPRPRLPRDPPHPAAPGTVAATSIAIVAGEGLASVMSARVSGLIPNTPGWPQGPSSGLQCPSSAWASGFPPPSRAPPAPWPAPHPTRFQCHPSLWRGLGPPGPPSPRGGLQCLPSPGLVTFL